MYYGYGYYPFFDPTMILVLIGVILSLAASAKVKSTFARYSKVRSMTGMTGAEAAQRLLNSQGIYDVTVRRVPGSLSDHYDPRTKTVNLSDDVYSSTSVAAIGVAAHECGHAIQHAVGYAPLNFRSALVPIANFGSQISWPLILIGILIGGFVPPSSSWELSCFRWQFCFSLSPFRLSSTLLQGVRLLDSTGILSGNEVDGTRRVLGAAALTYVAAAAGSILQLLRLIILFGGRRNND